MIVAVEGCAHGELDQIYRSVENLANQRGVKVDLLICCGDFQAVRNENDLQCMAVPDKFRHMCTFYKYYSGEKTAPILTIFIGGNHEASNYLQELPYGGWVAPNIYYLGYAGVVQVANLKIAGISGIFKGHDFLRGHFEKPPYNQSTMRSAYHVRNLEVFRLKQLKEKIDIFLSHDWPRGIYNYGDTTELLHWKPFFGQEIANNTLGSQAAETLLHELKPNYWFSAHLHCRFAATVNHNDQEKTEFLALDKCLPRRKYLELIDIPHDTTRSIELSYDAEWLAVLRLTNHFLSVETTSQYLPSGGPGCRERWDFRPTEQDIADAKERLQNDLRVPSNFTKTADAYQTGNQVNRRARQPDAQLNPQTTEFCRKLGIDDPMRKLIGEPVPLPPVENPDEINIDDIDDAEEDVGDAKAEKPEQNDLFFIDSNPHKRSIMNLPPPSSDSGAHEESAVKEPARNEKTTFSETLEEQGTSEAMPVVKKLKRRNQALYTNDENEF